MEISTTGAEKAWAKATGQGLLGFVSKRRKASFHLPCGLCLFPSLIPVQIRQLLGASLFLLVAEAGVSYKMPSYHVWEVG